MLLPLMRATFIIGTMYQRVVLPCLLVLSSRCLRLQEAQPTMQRLYYKVMQAAEACVRQLLLRLMAMAVLAVPVILIVAALPVSRPAQMASVLVVMSKNKTLLSITVRKLHLSCIPFWA